ncbi:MAG: hypothetical protein ACE5JL_19695 [Dehalococcoidia bacterium]
MRAEEKIVDVHWSSVWIGYGIAVAVTLILGAVAFWAYENVWLIALGGEVALFLGGAIAARRTPAAQALNGAFIGLLYFATTIVFIFSGVMTEKLPDPLPGLPLGDSTFFFVWPLAQVLASTLGALVGSRSSTGPIERKDAKGRRR